jgi:micrococcal nuclease
MTACPAIAALIFGLVCEAEIGRIVDGDTAYMRFGSEMHSVRVIGVDTPEIGERGFTEATKAIERRYAGKTATLTIGGAKSRRNGLCVGKALTDRYGRVLAAVKGWKAAIRSFDKGPWCR